MMQRYEVLLLAVPEITQDETKQLESEIDRLVAAAKGTMISFEKWGKYKLFYPIRKNEYGVYFLARFETEQPEPLMNEVKTLLGVKLHEVVMRFMLAKLDAHQQLTYQRPQSLEEAPAREVGGFMKDSKADAMTHDDADVQEL